MKVVINGAYGGFSLSKEAVEYLAKLKGLPLSYAESAIYPRIDGLPQYSYFQDRSDPDLIKVVEDLGDKVNDICSNIKIVEIPDGVEYEIYATGGKEYIHEVHRVWS